ncbi:MAG: T9SS type A sorting domain-containing protein [Flavobacteriia bacterium]|jgi:lysyl endopeptidase
MRNKILQSIALSLFVGLLSAQVQKLGTPISFKNKVGLTKNGFVLPVINNLESLNYYTNLAQANGEKMMQYGVSHNVQINFFSNAEKKVLPNGDNLYQFFIESQNAISLNVIFSKFHLEQGTVLYIFNQERTKYIGAYTSLNNNIQNELGTELLYTEKLFIEVQEPKLNENKSILEIGRIIHGFVNLDDLVEKALNESGDCNIDVNCPQGGGWEIPRNGVAMMVNGTGGFCTGSMVNNTAGTTTPYFLTANHCGSGPGSWVFRFRWESPADQADCGTNAPSVNGPENMNINGGVTRANYGPSDFHLIELNSIPDQLWDVTYNGWDKSGVAPSSGAGIHHPSGDIKKIAISSSTFGVGSFGGSPQNHWRAYWSDGVTEGGSSGSPLFDQYRRIVGQLHGGGSYCGSNDMSDFYGQFSASWIGGGTPSTRLSDWLDPQNTGVDFIDANVTNSLDPFFTSNVIGAQGTFCSGTYTPKVVLTNGGSVIMTSATITYNIDGVDQTFSWNGNLGLFESDTITLPTQNFNGGSHTISITVSNPNGTIDENLNNNTVSNTFLVIVGGQQYVLELNLDCYANETTWEIIDSNSNVIFNGGPYEDINANYTVSEDICLNAGCYDLIVNDEYGDGMSSSQCDDGSFNIHDSNLDTLAFLDSAEANFGFSIAKNFCINVSELEILENTSISIFPNPIVDYVYVTSENLLEEIIISDITGKVIFQQKINLNQFKLKLDFNSGVYFIYVKDSKNELIKKLVK